jgi:pyridoxamine 5'-phosphate oxidase
VNKQPYANPLDVFCAWYEEAKSGAPIDPDIIALASATAEGRPSVRMVLFRGLREGGFSFFTNYQSRKGVELSENAFAAIAFYWAHLGKQVRIEGAVERLSPEASDGYFLQRPLLSQITANLSLQSRPMTDEREFLKRVEELEQLSKTSPVVRSPEWGGFKLMPIRYEFWTHREHRRHERLLYEKSGNEWKQSRLYP